MKRWIERIFFPRASARPLAALRIGLSAVLIFQAFLIAPQLNDLWGPQGYYQQQLSQYIIAPNVPLMLDLRSIASTLHTGVSSLVVYIFLVYIAALASMMIGFQSRWMAVLSCVCHLLLKFNQGQYSTYGVDSFSQMFLFYCCIFPVGDAWSIKPVRQPSIERQQMYGFALRLMQVHLCIAYFSSGIAKALGEQWQTGEVIWRAFNLPQFHVFDMSWLAHVGFLMTAIAWGTLFLEIGYPVLVGWRRSRVLGALAVISMHLGIGLLMGLVTFALCMIALNASLFLVPSEPDSGTVL